MNYDGIATIAVNVTGDKYYIVDKYIPQHKLCDVLDEDSEIYQLGDSLPKGTSDVLVTVFFTYHSYPDGPWEYPESEWAISLNVGTHVKVKNGYKNLWKLEIEESRKYAIDEEDLKIFNEDVAEWEDFYDCEFHSESTESPSDSGSRKGSGGSHE